MAFGKGPGGFWTNCFPSKLVRHFASDIKKFGLFLKLVKWGMPVMGMIPIHIMLRLMLFTRDFGDRMVYPLIALFLGTGNQTPYVPSAIVERLFDDPNMKLWDYDPSTLLPNLPEMYTFGNLHDFYEAWRQDLTSQGVNIRIGTEVTRIASRSDEGVILHTRSGAADGEDTQEVYDELILCTLADDALKLLGKGASRRERFVLGGARFYDDVTVTHSDSSYFARHYQTSFDPALCAEPRTPAERDQVAFARGDDPQAPGGFRPMYFTKSYTSDMRKIEMSFDCSNYQHQLLRATGPRDDNGTPHVYQSIFLDKRNESLWSWKEIDEDKIIQTKWWCVQALRFPRPLRRAPFAVYLYLPKVGSYSRDDVLNLKLSKAPTRSSLAALHPRCSGDDVYQWTKPHLLRRFVDIGGQSLPQLTNLPPTFASPN